LYPDGSSSRILPHTMDLPTPTLPTISTAIGDTRKRSVW
jgi:hypothetical protein